MHVRYIWPAVMLVAVACGGDDEATLAAQATDAPPAATEAAAEPTEAAAEPTEAAAEPTEVAAADGESTTTAGLPAECVPPPYDIAIRRSGDGENEVFTVVDAEDDGFGAGNGQNLAYKVWAADYDIADDQDLITQIMSENIPAGSTVVNVSLGRVYDSDNETPGNEYPNIVAGEDLQAFRLASGPDSVLGVQVVIIDSDGVTSPTTVNETATGTVLYADEDMFCIDVDMTSESGYQLKGIFTATVR
jgi:hypothetical protein